MQRPWSGRKHRTQEDLVEPCGWSAEGKRGVGRNEAETGQGSSSARLRK